MVEKRTDAYCLSDQFSILTLQHFLKTEKLPLPLPSALYITALNLP